MDRGPESGEGTGNGPGGPLPWPDAHAVLDAVFAFIGIFTPEGVIIETNRAPLEAAGLIREQVLGQRLVDLPWWTPTERERVREAIARAAGGESSRFDTSVKRIAGGIMHVDAAYAPLRDATGAIRYVVASGVDVTARKEAEAARAASEFMLREAERLAHIGGWRWDIEPNTLAWSDELFRIYGLDPAAFQVTFDRFMERVHPEDRSHTRAVVERARRDATPFVYDHRVVRPDGSVRMLHTRGEAIPGPDGAAIRMVGSCWDVTDRWEATNRLERSISLLSATLEATADGILVIDNDRKVAAFNNRFLAIWRVPAQMMNEADDLQLLAMVRSRLVDPEVFAARVESLYRATEQESLDVLHFRDGRVIERYSCPQLVNGEAVGRVWSFRDITQKERLLRAAEQARAEAEEARNELDHILERVSDGFVALDGTWRYRYVNASAGRLLGRAPEKLLGKHIWSEFPEGRGQAFHKAYEQAIAEQRMVQLRALYPPWNRWFENRIYPSSDGLSIFFQDVTEQQLRDEQLQASTDELRALTARLEEIREEERRLLARELHDQVGQALTALRLDLGWLTAKLTGDGELRPRIATMEKLLDETLETTRRLSAELRPALLDDLGLVAAVAWQAQDFEARTGIPCELETAEREALAIEPARALTIFRVLQEALTNIARHAGAHRVWLRLAVEKEGERDEIVLTVRDDGRGMPAQGAIRPMTLGIVGMRERVAGLGGRLTITSAVGEGTTLVARIPKVAPRAS